MKLIVDISEEDYRECKFRKDLLSLGKEPADLTFNMRMETLIANGTPLPKGHGRLIDGSKLEQFTQLPDMTFELLAIDIFEAPTIIEADKGE